MHKYYATLISHNLVLIRQQIMTGKPPFCYYPMNPMVIMKVVTWERPNRPGENEAGEEIKDELWSLLTDCWAADATTQPLMRGVLKQLTRICAAENPLRLIDRSVLNL
jgi:hypothetical protein